MMRTKQDIKTASATPDKVRVYTGDEILRNKIEYAKKLESEAASAPETRKLPGRVIGRRHTPNQNDAPDYYIEQRTIPAEKPTAMLPTEREDWTREYKKLLAKSETAQAQAAQLAEALKGVMWKVDAFGSGWKPTQAEREAIAKALAAYEEGE